MVTQSSIDTQRPIQVARGGTGVASTTAYTVQCGGTTTTGPVQSIASVGTSGHILTSNGAGALPTFQTKVAGTFGTGTQLIHNSSSALVAYDLRQHTQWFDEMIYSNSTGTKLWPWQFYTTGSSTVTTIADESNHPGILRQITGTGSTDEANLYRNNTTDTGNDFIRMEALIRIPTLSDGTNTFSYQVGLSSGNASGPSDAILMEYRSTNSTNWRGICISASTPTRTSGTNVAVAANTWTHLAWELNQAASTASFWVDGTSIGTVTTNIPGGPQYIASMNVKTAGGTARGVDVDFIMFYSQFGTNRYT